MGGLARRGVRRAEQKIADFRAELEDVERVCALERKPMLIAMGGAAFVVLKWAARNKLLEGYDAVKIPHYSMYSGQEGYRRSVLAALRQPLRSSLAGFRQHGKMGLAEVDEPTDTKGVGLGMIVLGHGVS